MVYTILISIVFIAELIIAITIIQNILRLDKKIQELDEIIFASRQGINDITVLIKKISEQWVIITQNNVNKVKKNSEDAIFKHVLRLFLSILLVNLNLKFVNKIRKSKMIKIIAKGWSFFENMV